MMRAGTVLAVEKNGGLILGCIYIQDQENQGYMGQLAVDPAHQGKGLARLLSPLPSSFCAPGVAHPSRSQFSTHVLSFCPSIVILDLLNLARKKPTCRDRSSPE